MEICKKSLAILLCLTTLFCLSVFAEGELEPIPTPQNVVELSLNNTTVNVGSEGLVLTLTIDNLSGTLASITDLVIGIDKDLVSVTDIVPKEVDGAFVFAVDYDLETPTTEQVSIEIPLTVTDEALAVSPKTVNISVESITLADNSEPVNTLTPQIGDPVALTLQNEVINTKLTFNNPVYGTTDFAVAYQLVVGEEETAPEPINAILSLKNEGKAIKIETESPLGEGTYKVIVTANGYIVPEIANITIDAENLAPVFSLKLIPGDIDGDGTVNISDFHKLCTAVTNTSVDAIYDLNRDGAVDRKDITLLVKGWTTVYAQ